jgi:hypothetical protein
VIATITPAPSKRRSFASDALVLHEIIDDVDEWFGGMGGAIGA